MKLIVQLGVVDINHVVENDCLPCHQAAKLGYRDVLHSLLHLGAGIDARLPINRWTVLHSAVSGDQIEIVRWLLREKLVNVNAKSSVSVCERQLFVSYSSPSLSDWIYGTTISM